ncbi:MAG: choice-of-anchor J domain-containing protein [Phycisphaerae bacterium]
MTRRFLRSAMIGVCTLTLPAIANAQAFSEGFDDITTLPGSGWFMQNNSAPLGLTNFFQGNSTVFPAQAGAATAYIGTNYNNVTGANIISNWLVTPNRTFSNGDSLSFYTRTVSSVAFPDRLQVRLSTNGASTNVGTLATDVGDFGTLLLDINPTYTLTGYPNVWTQFTVTLSGLGGPTSGRLALRYFVEDGGPAGANSDYIGIDTVVYSPAGALAVSCGAPSPASVLPGGSSVLTATVTPATGPASTGITVSCNASSVGGGTVTMLDNGAPPDAVAGDNIFSGTVTVGGATAAGSYSLPTTASDAQSRTATCSMSLTVIPVPPVNDDCTGAIPVLCDSSTAGTLAAATVDFPTGGSILACANTPDQAEYHDRVGVWYTVTGNGNPMRASTCNAGTGFDTQIAVFSGACGSLVCVAGNDDAFSACSLSSLRSIVDFNSTLGTTYHIMVMPWATGSNSSTFVLDVICSLPLAVTCNAVGAVNQGGSATVSAAVTRGTNPTSTGIAVSLDASGVGGGTVTMLDDGVSPDAVAGDFTYTGTVSTTLSTTPGVYALPVSVTDAQSRTATCNISLTVLPPAPTNDACANPIIVPGVPYSITTDNSSGTADGIPGSCNSLSAVTMQNSLWWSFTPAASGDYQITVTDQTFFDSIAVVSTGTCGAQSEIANGCGDEPQPIGFTVNLAGGTTYLLQVGDWGVSPGGGLFVLTINSVGVTGACCLGSTSTPPMPPRTCTALTSIACTAAGGRYQGDGSVCTPGTSCCPGDVDGDFDVDESDLGALLANWLLSVTPNTGGDLNGDGVVNEPDLGILLSSWQCVVP